MRLIFASRIFLYHGKKGQNEFQLGTPSLAAITIYVCLSKQAFSIKLQANSICKQAFKLQAIKLQASKQ